MGGAVPERPGRVHAVTSPVDRHFSGVPARHHGLDGKRTTGGDPVENADTARAIFAGQPGPPRELAALNAGAAIYAGGGAGTLVEGVRRAQEAIDEGAAGQALERFVARTRELAP